MTLRIQSSLISLVLKVLRDGAPGHPVVLCMPPYCSSVSFFNSFCSPASGLLCILSLLPGRLSSARCLASSYLYFRPQGKCHSFNILELSLTSLPFQKKSLPFILLPLSPLPLLWSRTWSPLVWTAGFCLFFPAGLFPSSVFSMPQIYF